MSVRPQRVVIVGAGIVGLSTAYALLSQGVACYHPGTSGCRPQQVYFSRQFTLTTL